MSRMEHSRPAARHAKAWTVDASLPWGIVCGDSRGAECSETAFGIERSCKDGLEVPSKGSECGRTGTILSLFFVIEIVLL